MRFYQAHYGPDDFGKPRAFESEAIKDLEHAGLDTNGLILVKGLLYHETEFHGIAVIHI